MEGFKVEEGTTEVQSVGSDQGDGDVPEGFIVPNQSRGRVNVTDLASPCDQRADILREVLPSVQCMWHRKINRIASTIEGNDVAKSK